MAGEGPGRTDRPPGRYRRGVALIVVLWVMVVLSFLCVSFARDMVLEMDGARYFTDDVQAALAAASAVARARIALASYRPDPSDPADALLRDNPEEFRWVPLAGGSQGVAAGRAAGRTSDLERADASEAYYSLLGLRYDSDETLTFGLIDEAAKLNANVASWQSLARLPGMTDEVAQAIVDFRDPDSDPLPYGAEDEYYQSLSPARRAKNAPFDTLEELLLVRGVTPEVLYGEDTNRNGVLDPWENDGDASPPDDDQDGELDRGLADYLTVCSAEPNLNSQGRPRLSLNTTPRDQLRETLSAGIPPELLDRILEGGSGGPGGGRTSGAAPGRPPGGSGSGGGYRTMADLLRRVPQLLRPENRRALAYLLDVATVREEKVLPGLVNVNTAPVEVLAALPGLDEDTAEAIDAYRRQGEGGEFGSVVWLLEAGLSPERFLEVLPHVTVRSFQYRVQAVGVAGRRRVFRRLEVVLDRSRPGVPPIFWRDVTQWGVPFDLRAEAERSS